MEDIPGASCGRGRYTRGQTLPMSTRKWIAIATGVAFAAAPLIVALAAFPSDLKSDHFGDVMGISAMIGWGIGAPPALAIAGFLVFWRGPKGSKERADARTKGIVLWSLGLVCVAV